MRFIIIALVLILLGLQYKLWFGEDSVPKWFQVEKKRHKQIIENQALAERNQVLEADIAELKTGNQALEARARYELGMIKEDETYYHFAN